MGESEDENEESGKLMSSSSKELPQRRLCSLIVRGQSIRQNGGAGGVKERPAAQYRPSD